MNGLGRIVPGGEWVYPRTIALGFFLLLFLAVAPAVNAQESPAKPPAVPAPQAPSASVAREYLIGAQDVLVVTILEAPELTREVRVGADGMVSLPLLDRVNLQGLTLAQAEDLLEKKYREAGILNNPNVSVQLKDLISKPVTVAGAVRNPGVFQINGQTELFRILTQAGGLVEGAAAQVQVIRAGTTSAEQILRIRVDQVQNGELEANIPIYGGDTINVAPAGAVYVIGAVNKPGRHSMGGDAENFTVVRLIAMAESVTRTAKPDKAVLIRKDGSGALQQIPVDLKKILSKQQADLRMLHNDVLYVPDSTAKRAFRRGLEAALQVATSLAVFAVI
jgi:polysaccharide export outer membrane protein